MQTYAMMGYNSIPLPGGSGAYEFLYINIYEKANFTQEFILVTMMMTRIISYYLSMLISGIYTAAYHVLAPMRAKKRSEHESARTDEEAAEEFSLDIPLPPSEKTSTEKEG